MVVFIYHHYMFVDSCTQDRREYIMVSFIQYRTSPLPHQAQPTGLNRLVPPCGQPAAAAHCGSHAIAPAVAARSRATTPWKPTPASPAVPAWPAPAPSLPARATALSAPSAPSPPYPRPARRTGHWSKSAYAASPYVCSIPLLFLFLLREVN